MNMGLEIDHLYSLVDDRERAAAAMRASGFALTEAGMHAGRGTSNNLAVFAGPYWELLAVDAPTPSNRHLRALLESGPGLLGCALATTDIEADRTRLRRRGIEVAEAQDVSRPVRIGDRDDVARFRVAQIEPPAGFAGTFFFCEHLTPELVWPSPLPVHPNGAVGIDGLTVVSSEPRAAAERLARLFDSAIDRSDGWTVKAGALALRCLDPARLARFHPEAPRRFGSADRFAGIALRAPGVPAGSAQDPSLGDTIATWGAR